jgi:hypothetical protein
VKDIGGGVRNAPADDQTIEAVDDGRQVYLPAGI